jgi:hypothetical protein
LRATPTIDGRPVAVSFMSPAVQAQKLRDVTLVGAGAAAAIGLILLLVLTVLSRRSQTGELLAQTEAMAAAKLSRAERSDRMQAQGRMLDQLNLKDQRLSEVLAEVAWASKVKSPSAHVQALHWDHGFLALESDGDKPPIDTLDVPMQRSHAPVRPGVWLWGLTSTDPWTSGLNDIVAQNDDAGSSK